jgi:hypothetical protein
MALTQVISCDVSFPQEYEALERRVPRHVSVPNRKRNGAHYSASNVSSSKLWVLKSKPWSAGLGVPHEAKRDEARRALCSPKDLQCDNDRLFALAAGDAHLCWSSGAIGRAYATCYMGPVTWCRCLPLKWCSELHSSLWAARRFPQHSAVHRLATVGS